MPAIEQAIRLVSEPPGSLIYHLTVLFSLWAGLLTSLAHWRHSRSPRSASLAAAASGLLAIRFALIAAAALAWRGMLDADSVLPPLDRAGAAAGIVLLAWALALPNASRLSYAVLGALLLATLVGYLAAAADWPPRAETGLAYSDSAQAMAWEWVDFLALGAGLILLLLRRPAEWGLSLGLLLTLVLGHVVHYVTRLPGTHIAGAERLAELAAFPLLAVLSLRTALDEGAAVRARPALRPARPTAEPDKPKGGLDPQLARDLAAALAMEPGSDLGPAVARAVARAMRADLCLIVVPGKDRNTADAPHGYDLIREQAIPGRNLPLASMPTLASALQRGKALRLTEDRHAAELGTLAGRLNAPHAGPAIVAPLETAGRNLGSLLLFSPYAQRTWTPEDQQLLTTLAAAMTAALIRHETLAEWARRHATLAAKLEDATHQLHQAQAQSDKLAQSLEETRSRAEVEREQARSLAALVGARGDEQATLAEMRAMLDELQAQLAATHAQSEAQRAELDQVRAAVVEADDLRREVAEQTATIQRLQAELAKAASGAPAAHSDTSLLESELRLALRDNARLTSRLAEADQRLSQVQAAAEHGPGSELDREVIASITQELRQPMSSIVGYTDLLLGESVGILGALQRKFLERVKAGTERMGTLLDDLLRVTAIDTGTLRLEPETVDVVGVIDDAITHSSSQFREKNITLRMDIADDLPPVHADRDAMSQVMTHLLNNAAMASRPDGEVLVSAHYQMEDMDGQETGLLLISVADSGAGIASEDYPRVFTRLYRADNPLIEGLGDTGVGLSIVKALVEAHGGRVWVESERGVGSTISILLPYAAEAAPQNGAQTR